MGRELEDVKQLIKDIEFMTPEVINALFWGHFRELCGGIGLKTKIGGRELLTKRLEVVRRRRFELRDFI